MSVLLQIMASAAIQAWVIMASATIQAWGIQVPKGSRVDSENLSFQTYAHASSVEQSNPTTHVNNDDSTEQQGVTIYICCTLLHMRYTSSTVLRPRRDSCHNQVSAAWRCTSHRFKSFAYGRCADTAVVYASGTRKTCISCWGMV